MPTPLVLEEEDVTFFPAFVFRWAYVSLHELKNEEKLVEKQIKWASSYERAALVSVRWFDRTIDSHKPSQSSTNKKPRKREIPEKQKYIFVEDRGKELSKNESKEMI